MKRQSLVIRRAHEDESGLLTELTIRSKAYWGYDASFMTDARPQLEFSPSDFKPDFHVYILESQKELLGFCSLKAVDETTMELCHLFIEPRVVRMGYGKQLWHYAVDRARELGFHTLILTADPNAKAFYVHQGAVCIGERQSPIRPNRPLPLMTYRLQAVRGHARNVSKE